MDERSSFRRAAVDAMAGALAGGVSRNIVAPLDVVKIRFQVQLEPTSTRLLLRVPHGVSKYTGILQAMREILQEEGLWGLWRGNVPALLLVMPYTAIQFVVLQAVTSHVAKGGEFSPLMSYLGGSLAGCAATMGSYPFDLLRTVLASQGEPKVYSNMRSAFWKIYQSRGIRGLYSGLTPSLVEIVPYAGLQFGSYDTFKRWAIVWNQQKATTHESAAEGLSGLQNFVCGLGAGTVAKAFCHPLDVVKKRYQIEGLARHQRYGATLEKRAYKSVGHAIIKILESEGWAGLYKGLFPSIVKAGPAAAVTFVVYERASKWLEHM